MCTKVACAVYDMSNTLLARASWRFFTRHPWQLWLTLLSIALGTAVIIAVDLANQSAGQSFRASVNALSGTMTHEITAVRGNVPDDFYRQLRVEWGYRESAPVVEVAIEKEGLQATLLGIDPFAAPLQQAAGVDIDAEEVRQLLTEPGARVRISDELWVADIATVQGLAPNCPPIPSPSPARGEGSKTEDGRTSCPFPPCGGRLGWGECSASGLTKIQLKLTDEQAAELQARLPPALKLESFAARQQVFTQMTQAFSTNLLAMSLLAMLVGAFLVYNTMTFSVLQRRQAFAIGRMVGVTGGQLFRHLLLEALVLGVVGSVLGVLLGVLLGQGLLVLVTQTISDLYVSVRATDLLLTPVVLLKGVGITLLAVLVATLAPAWEAAQVSPVQVQRQSTLEQGNQRRGTGLAVAGVVLMLASAGLIGYSGKQLVTGFFGLFLLIVGYSLCVPLVLRMALHGLQRLRLHLLLRMAIRGVQASLSRTSLAIIALTVAVSATVGVSIMIGSFRASVAEWLEMTLASDVYVSATSQEASRVDGSLHPDWLARVQALEGVEAVSTGRTTRLTVEDFPMPVLVLQPSRYSGRGFAFLEGDAAAIWQRFLAGEGLLVSEPFAYHRGKRRGDTVQVTTEVAGKVNLPVLGVFRDYSATQGMVVLPRGLYERYWADRGISSIGIQAAAGADVAALKRQLQTWAGELQQAGQPLVVRSNQDIREFSLQVFDRTFAITNVLRLLVIIVAFVGVFSALMALFLEKGREFAILRATGFTPQQLQRLVLGQAALIGLLAGLLSLPLGWLLSVVLIEIINQRSFGWTMQTHVFALVPLQAVALALVAALLASIYPVRRIGRASVREGLDAR
ncbi:putative ABC transport system permease protein [Thiothrix caldifontis]|uniref:Putative ABC transport system permease protein n=1 Tax=Thiothrix caldifontis TaxID=525918 RepID=A0A1H3W500_9GAMM|nr:FtsX-like permease family protein [Thiothrix caldifontis]SDZ82136.1 putative ABC transport system permease protein [Thiothrix caldifontis]